MCASNGTKLLASICINRKSFPVMCVSHSVHDSKLDESDLGRVPFRTSLQGWPTRDGCRNLKSSKPAQRGGGDEDDGCDNGRAAVTPTASNGLPRSRPGARVHRPPTSGRSGGWARCPPASITISPAIPRRRTARRLRQPSRMVDGRRTAGAKVGHRKPAAIPRPRWRACQTRKSRKPADTIAQFIAELARV